MSTRRRDPRRKGHTDKITTLTRNVLDQIARESGGELAESDIENLDFSGEWFDLDSLDGLSLVTWRHLLVLDVSNNSLESLEDVLNRFLTLRTIAASNNLITKVSLALPNLKELDLSKNFLNSVPDLSRLGGLEKLLLAFNEIREGFDEFNFVPKLTTLDLSRNKMNFTGGQFKEFLDTLSERTIVHSLKVDDNPFARDIPNYEIFCIKALPLLQNLNGDLVPKDRQRQIRGDRTFRLEELMTMGKETRRAKAETERAKTLPTIADLRVFLEKAKSEPTECLNHIKALAISADRLVSRPSDRVYMFKTNSVEEMTVIRMEIDSFLQEIIIMLEDLPTIRLPLLRIIANLSEITELNFGQRCLSVLQDLLDAGPEISKDIKLVFESIIIPKLQTPELKSLSKDMLIGVIRLSEAYEVADKFQTLIQPMEHWLNEELKLEEMRLIMSDITGEETDGELHSLALALISEAAKDEENVTQMLRRQMPTLACKLIKAIERETEPAHLFSGQFDSEKANWHRMLHLLTIIERTATNNIEAARIYNSEDLHQKLTRDLWEYLMVYKANGYSFSKGNENQEVEIFQYSLVSAYINALTGMCGVDQTIQFLNSEAVQVREELLAVSIMPQTDPVLLTAIIYLILKLLKSDLLLDSDHFPTFNDIAGKLHKCLPFLPYLGGKKYKDLCMLGEKYSKGTIVAMEPVPPSSLSNYIIHRLFIAIIQVIQFFCGQAAKGEDNQLGSLCRDVSNAMNKNKREDYLFTCLEVPSDNIKLAVVKCLDKIPLDEIDLEEFGHVVRVLGSYKNLGVGKTEEVLSYIFLLLTKVTRDTGLQGEDFRSKLGEMVIVECLSILSRNQERNLLNDAEEHEEKMSLTIACVFFLRTASKYKNLKQHMNNTVAVEALKRVLKAEEIYSRSWKLPVDIERTWTGKSVDTLLKCFQGSSILVPYHEVSMRTMARLADVLVNRKDEPVLDPWKSGDDDIIRTLRQQLEKREEERHREEEGIWEELGPKDTSDDFEVWRQGHMTFVQTKAIDFLLNYLMGRNSLLGTELDAKLKSEYRMEYQKNQLLQLVKTKLEKLEKEVQEAEEEEDKQALKKLTIEKKEKEITNTGELLANALQGETLDEGRTLLDSDENLVAAYKGSKLREADLRVKARMLGAYLRCIKATLEHAPNEELREQVVETIKNPKFLKDLTMLCATSQWKYGAIAGKYLRVVKHVIDIPPKDNEAYDEHVSFLETVSLAVSDILQTLVPKLSDRERNPLNSQDQFLIAEVTNIAAIMCRSSTINRWSARIENKFDETTSMVTVSVQDKVVGFVIKRLIPMEAMKAFTEIIFYEMAFSSRFKPLAYKRSLAESALMDRARVNIAEVFGYYMTYCYKLRYQILELLQTGFVFDDEQLRNTYMQDLLNRYQSIMFANELGKYILKNHLAFQVGTSNIPERIMLCSWTDVSINRSSRLSKQLFLVTSRKIYILNENSSPPCPMCGPERFCPSGPTLKTVINYEDIRLIVRFKEMPQMLGLEFLSGTTESLWVFFFPMYDSAVNYAEKIEYIANISNRMKGQMHSCVSGVEVSVMDNLNATLKEKGFGTTFRTVVLCSYQPKSFVLWKRSQAIPDMHFAVVTDKNVLCLFEINISAWNLYLNPNLLGEDNLLEEMKKQNPALAEYTQSVPRASFSQLFTLKGRVDPSFVKNVYVPEGSEIKFVITAEREYTLSFAGDLSLEVLQRTFMKPIIAARTGTKISKELSQLKGK